MKSKLMIAAMSAALLTPAGTFAQTSSQPHVYHRPAHSYHYRCKRSKGTTGLLAGAGVGGIGAAALGAGPVGIAAGVVGGGLLGRHIDKKHDAAQNRKNGC